MCNAFFQGEDALKGFFRVSLSNDGVSSAESQMSERLICHFTGKQTVTCFTFQNDTHKDSQFDLSFKRKQVSLRAERFAKIIKLQLIFPIAIVIFFVQLFLSAPSYVLLNNTLEEMNTSINCSSFCNT